MQRHRTFSSECCADAMCAAAEQDQAEFDGSPEGNAISAMKAEIEHLTRFVDFVNLWCNRTSKVSDSERLGVIKHHPTAQARLKERPID